MPPVLQNADRPSTRIDTDPGRNDMPVCMQERTYVVIPSHMEHDRFIETDVKFKSKTYNTPDPKKANKMISKKRDGPRSGVGAIAVMADAPCKDICSTY